MKKEHHEEEVKTVAPEGVAALIEKEKHATREEVDAMTNKVTNPNEVNIIQQLAKKPEEVKKAKEKPLSEAEFERRTKLDVSDPNYINPSLDHYRG